MGIEDFSRIFFPKNCCCKDLQPAGRAACSASREFAGRSGWLCAAGAWPCPRNSATQTPQKSPQIQHPGIPQPWNSLDNHAQEGWGVRDLRVGRNKNKMGEVWGCSGLGCARKGWRNLGFWEVSLHTAGWDWMGLKVFPILDIGIQNPKKWFLKKSSRTS